MRKILSILFALALVLSFSVVATTPVVAAGPASTPPVTLGPKTLTGDGSPPTAYEFFLQAGSTWKGDIGGIAAGPTYSLVILDIDLTGVTGPAGRYVYFNLQDAENGSTFKNLGINVILQQVGAGGTALLQCYQSFTSEGISSHGFNAGELTEHNLDLRFDFSKASSGVGWTVTPYYRLSSGCWSQFFDGTFVSTTSFDFLGAKLVVAFDGGADGTVSFANYYLSVSPSSVCVATATGTGTASMTPGTGEIGYLTPVAAPSLPSVTFPHGMFSFQICCLTPGETVILTIVLPSAVPVGTVWWKYDNGRWYSLPNLNDNGNNIMVIRLTDGGVGDSDGLADGFITDPGGPGNPMTVGWDGSPVSKSTILWPWIALLAALMAGLGLFLRRRGRAEV